MATAVACLLLYGVAGFFVIPPIARSQAQKRLSAELGRAVSIGKLRVNPYMLSAAIEDFDVAERDGRGSFLGWKRLYVRFDALRSLAGAWVLGDIELDGFHAVAVVNPDGSFNFSDLISKFAPPPAGPPPKPAPSVLIGSLRVSQARVDFSDHSLRHPFATTIGPVTFSLTGFQATGRRGAPYQFAAKTEAGERLEWKGTLSANPFESRGEFDVENVVLKKYSPYLEARSRADLTAGKLSLRGRYHLDLSPMRRVLVLGDSEVHLRDLRVVERSSGRPVLELDALDVTGIRADAAQPMASAERVALTGGHLTVRRNKDGSVNLLSLMGPPAAAPQGAGASAAPAAVPMVSAGEVALKDFWVDIADDAPSHRAQLSLRSLQLSLENFTLADEATMPLRLSFEWAPKGTVELDGTVALKPGPRADLKANIAAMEILPFSPYIEELVNARVTQGAVSASCSLRASLASGQPAVALEGDMAVENLGIVDAARDKALLGLTRLRLSGVKAATAPRLTASVRQVDLLGPYVRVRVDADRSLNLASLLRRAEPSAAGPPGAAAAAGPAPKIEIGRVAIADGDFSFTDMSVEPNVRVSLSEFAGVISGLSSENLARADVALKGMVGDQGPVEITGKLDPLGAHRYVGLDVGMKNVDLLPLSPYMGKYAGYELARGQLVVDSRVTVDGEKLDSTVVVTLNKFTLGSATSSPDATALPVRLGVALLKDVDGKIVIDLPLEGSLADPSFRIGKVVLRVVVNLLTKAAVSPFTLLGSMFGGGGEELSFQEFAPGSSELQASELPKLGVVAKALANRPGLSLGLEGGYDTTADTYALKRSMLAELVRGQIWEESHAADPNIAPPDRLEISPEENAAMVKKLFDSKFPPGTQFGTPLPPPPAVEPPPPSPPPGLLARIVNALTSRRERDEAAARKRAEDLAAQHAKDVEQAAAAGLPLEVMTGRLAESIQVGANDLGALATERARRVRAYLIDTGRIAPERLFLAQGAGQKEHATGPRVLLSLQ